MILEDTFENVRQLSFKRTVTAAGHERITNGNTALAHWIGRREAKIG